MTHVIILGGGSAEYYRSYQEREDAEQLASTLINDKSMSCSVLTDGDLLQLHTVGLISGTPDETIETIKRSCSA